MTDIITLSRLEKDSEPYRAIRTTPEPSLFGDSVQGPPGSEQKAVLRRLHDNFLENAQASHMGPAPIPGCTAGILAPDDEDAAIVESIFRSLVKRGLAKVSRQEVVNFYEITDAGEATLAAIDAGQTIELTDPQEPWHRGA